MNEEIRRLRLPLILGGGPMVVGLLVFALWFLTGWDRLMAVGLFTLFAGLLCFLLGLVRLGMAIVLMKRAGRWRRDVKVRAAVVFLVMALNFPVAAAIIWSVIYLETTCSLTVSNHGATPVTHAQLTLGGDSIPLGQINPGESLTRRIRTAGKDALAFSGEQNGKKLEVKVEDYLAQSGGSREEIEIRPDGTAKVVSAFR